MNDQHIFKPWNKYEEDLEIYMNRFLNDKLCHLCFQKIMDFEVSFAYSEEPVPFADIHTLTFLPIQIGGIWADHNFACAWFHLTKTLPENIDKSELYLEFDNDGEGLLIDQHGTSVKGFTSGSPVFGVIDHSVEKRYYPLENFISKNGTIDLYIDGASNSLLGEYVHDASRLKAAAVVRRNPQMQEIYWDFDTLMDYVHQASATDPHKFEILYGLRSIYNLIMYEDPDYYTKAKEITTRLFALPGNENLSVTAVGHAHLDLAWLWPIRESKRKAKRTLANMIDLLEKYEDFRFVIPQPQQLVWIKEEDRTLYEKILFYEKQGKIELVGGGWVENDTNLTGEESLVRQELYGQKFWQEEFGHYVHLRWLPDAFGYTGSLPQILKLSEQDYFMTIKISWSNRTLFPYNTFSWKGIDGSEVIVHMPPEGNYNSVAGPKALLTGKAGIKEKDPQDKMMMVFGVGDGGGGPSKTMTERCLRTKNVPYLPKVKMGTALPYFENLKNDKLPVYKGEMYLEKHRGTYTSQSNCKNFNREFEEKMLSLETLLSCLGRFGKKEEIDALWKEALLYQFHDILPGSSIQRVYEETDIAYKKMLQKLEELANMEEASFLPGMALLNPNGAPVFYLAKKEDGYLCYQGTDTLLSPIVYDSGVSCPLPKTIETAAFCVSFAEDGSFSSITLNGEDTPLIENANRLRVFIDLGDAWDFEDDYREQPEQYMTLTSTAVRTFGALTEIVQTYRYKASTLTQTILFHEEDPCIRIFHDVNWKDTGYMVRAEFSPKVWSDTVCSDIQFGYLDRPTTDHTAHEKAQFEMCCQKWFDLSDETHGISILNHTKNGFMAKNQLISLNLLRSTNYPCIQGDQTPVHYSYALYPHKGGFDPIKTDNLAQQFNTNYLYGTHKLCAPTFDKEQIQITAFKPEYNGKHFILRAFERTGKEASATLHLPEGFELLEEVNLLEDRLGDISKDKQMTFKPFQIRSFRIAYTKH